jgi:hypothetical protein
LALINPGAFWLIDHLAINPIIIFNSGHVCSLHK